MASPQKMPKHPPPFKSPRITPLVLWEIIKSYLELRLYEKFTLKFSRIPDSNSDSYFEVICLNP